MPDTLNVFYGFVKWRQMPLTPGSATMPKIADMPRKIIPIGRGGREPTKMGRRILDFMKSLQITNHSNFAQSIRLSRQTFHAWLYKEINPENVAALPMLMCAEALCTNPEYLLGVSDDPRPATALTYREAQLLEAFRGMTEEDQDRILRMATDWGGKVAAPSASNPFRLPHPSSTTKAPK